MNKRSVAHAIRVWTKWKLILKFLLLLKLQTEKSAASPSPHQGESPGKDDSQPAFYLLYKPEKHFMEKVGIQSVGENVRMSMMCWEHFSYSTVKEVERNVCLLTAAHLAQVDHGEDVWVKFATHDPRSLPRHILILWTNRRQLRLGPPWSGQTFTIFTERASQLWI